MALKRRAMPSRKEGDTTAADSSKRGGRRRSASPVEKRRRIFSPAVLARGMSARWVGARIMPNVNILTADEIERDLRHMEAYANAGTAYAQQYFIFTNGGRTTAATTANMALVRPDLAMPVRIDPEEERRISELRKRIASCEAQREILETQYVSLMAHYVHESKSLETVRHSVDGQIEFLQDLVGKRGKVVALQRVRCAVARDVLRCLQRRTELAESAAGGLLQEEDKLDDVLQVWNDIEAQLRDAERACRSLKIPDALLKVKQNRTSAKADDDSLIPWDARTLPRTPYEVPVMLSQLSSVPDKGAAFGCGGVFGSKQSSMCWIKENLPKTCENMNREKQDVAGLSEDCAFLWEELQKERTANKELQSKISERRKRNDEMCAVMTMLRSETEAVLSRHNILLDTPEARAVAKDLLQATTSKWSETAALREQEQQEESNPVQELEGLDVEFHERMHSDNDMDHDGDDEGDDDADEEISDKHADAMFD